MDLDELFGDGVDLGDGVVAKARLRFRVHPPRHHVAQDIVDQLVASYDERLDMICGEVTTVLDYVDPRRTTRLVLALPAPDLAKAPSQPYAPGSRGGKWYRDATGKVRYGEPPQPSFKQQTTDLGFNASADAPGSLKPASFMGAFGADRDITDYLLANGDKHGFSANQLRFLGSWYGTDSDRGALFDAFLDCANLTRDDLREDMSQFRFGSQELTYEEAVFEFFAAQSSLFMGHEPESPDEQREWERILNDEIRPALDDIFNRYEALKKDPTFQEDFIAAPDRRRRAFFERAKKVEKETRGIADRVISSPDPRRQVADVIAGLRALNLFVSDAAADRAVRVHGRPHLHGSVALDDHLLADDPARNPLLAESEALAQLHASQLMLLYLGAELHRRWDHHARAYSTEPQDAVAPSAIGDAALDALATKSKRWSEAVALVHKDLAGLVDKLVTTLNEAGASRDVVFGDDAESTRKRAKKRAV